jgi:hypothetical protein
MADGVFGHRAAPVIDILKTDDGTLRDIGSLAVNLHGRSADGVNLGFCLNAVKAINSADVAPPILQDCPRTRPQNPRQSVPWATS